MTVDGARPLPQETLRNTFADALRERTRTLHVEAERSGIVHEILRLGRIAGMKMEGYGTCPGNADVPRELRIGSHDPSAHRACDGRVEVRNLPTGMHTGICPPGTNDFNTFSRNARQGLLYQALNGA